MGPMRGWYLWYREVVRVGKGQVSVEGSCLDCDLVDLDDMFDYFIPKPILDVLKGMVFTGDSQVFDLICRKRDLNDDPQIQNQSPELIEYLILQPHLYWLGIFTEDRTLIRPCPAKDGTVEQYLEHWHSQASLAFRPIICGCSTRR